MFGNLLDTVFFEILFTIDAYLYKFFSFLYGIYIDLANTIILTGDTYELIFDRINVIVGIIALFMVAYALLQNIINPENKNKDNGAAIVKKIIIAIVVVVLTPVLFDFLYGVQNAILSGNVISNIINGQSVDDEYMVYMSVDIDVSDGEENEYLTYYVCSSCTGDDYEACYNSGYTKLASSISDPSVEGVCNGYDVLSYTEASETATVTQSTAGNKLALTILEGFYQVEDEQMQVDLSDFVLGATGSALFYGALVCGVTVTAGAVFSIATGGTGIGVAALAAAKVCGIAAAAVSAGVFVYSGTLAIFSGNPTWEQFKIDAILYGNFENLIPFSSVVGEQMDYLPIVSTIAAAVLIWLMFNFILDMAVRIVKLAFYQVIAPLPAFLSILPGNSDLLKNYFKTLFTVYLEVFIRVLCLALIGFMANLLYELNDYSLLLKAMIMFGILSLLKEFPKMFSEVTGIKSGNMKLGIKDKLAAGGVFAAGGLGYAGVTGMTRRINKEREKFSKLPEEEKNWKKGWRHALRSTGNVVAGTTSSVFNARGAAGAKSFKEGIESGKKGVNTSEDHNSAREKKRIAYKSDSKNYFQGKYSDAKNKVNLWSGKEISTRDLEKRIANREEIEKTFESIENIGKGVAQKHEVRTDSAIFKKAVYDTLYKEYQENLSKIENDSTLTENEMNIAKNELLDKYKRLNGKMQKVGSAAKMDQIYATSQASYNKDVKYEKIGKFKTDDDIKNNFTEYQLAVKDWHEKYNKSFNANVTEQLVTGNRIGALAKPKFDGSTAEVQVAHKDVTALIKANHVDYEIPFEILDNPDAFTYEKNEGYVNDARPRNFDDKGELSDRKRNERLSGESDKSK